MGTTPKSSRERRDAPLTNQELAVAAGHRRTGLVVSLAIVGVACAVASVRLGRFCWDGGAWSCPATPMGSLYEIIAALGFGAVAALIAAVAALVRRPSL